MHEKPEAAADAVRFKDSELGKALAHKGAALAAVTTVTGLAHKGAALAARLDHLDSLPVPVTHPGQGLAYHHTDNVTDSVADKSNDRARALTHKDAALADKLAARRQWELGGADAVAGAGSAGNAGGNVHSAGGNQAGAAGGKGAGPVSPRAAAGEAGHGAGVEEGDAARRGRVPVRSYATPRAGPRMSAREGRPGREQAVGESPRSPRVRGKCVCVCVCV